MVYLRFRGWFKELDTNLDRIDCVLFEEVRGHRGTTAAQIFGGFLAHLTAWAEDNQTPYEGVRDGAIKRHITGKGNASQEEVIAAVRAKGFSPVDDNDADALALLDWAIANRYGGGDQ
jgi:crossover junction endodeoxyribonuclease RuvC